MAHCLECVGAILEIITDKSQEGAQFVAGFGGLGGLYWQYYHSAALYLTPRATGLLRYRVDFQAIDDTEEETFDIDLDDLGL